HLYYIADITFVGGRLIDTGGHSLLEPAALAKPILSGPSLFNFSQISKELIRNKALIRIRNQQEIAKNIIKIQEDKQQLQHKTSGALNTL
ncbi:3-deoxy-D-manno-octulosonic acid transferase, partial [Francisella tularensis subsp. holarctica]|nr:3-deoxy-D-manno-octulosonic acid transferase [Francisella tularensis subsp. holarctica]